MKLFLFLLLSGLFLTGCFFFEGQNNQGPREFKGDIFGSYYIIKFVGELDEKVFDAELAILFKDFNDEFSTYQKDSVISSFNRLPANKRLKVGPRFIEMLKFCKDLSIETKGAFEPTLGPVVKLWGFGGGKRKGVPSDKMIAEARKKVGMQYLSWDERSNEVWKTKEGVELDVNAFAPGWAADLIGELLLRHGVNSYMVDISGELTIRGEKSPGNPWIIGIERPSEVHGKAVQIALKITGGAVATSGSYRQFFDEKGERRSHIIDPRSGRPVGHRVSSATVIADSALKADAWSTAMMVLGKEGVQLAEANGVKSYLLEAVKPGEFEVITSQSMDMFMSKNSL